MDTQLSLINSKFMQTGLWLAEHPRIVQVGVALALVGLMLAATLFPQHLVFACPAGAGGSGAGGCSF